MDSKEIANTIQQQIFAIGMPIVWSWGASNYVNINTQSLKKDFNGIKGLGALKFLVNGAKFQGVVLVVLNYIDTYDVFFGNFEDTTFKPQQTLENVYCFELAEKIDEVVEKQENYKF